jgi:hypothetical protein
MLQPIGEMRNESIFTELHRTLIDGYDLEELRTLCAQLGVNFDDLRGEGRQAKARELILWFQRRGKLDELDAIIQEVRRARQMQAGTPSQPPQSVQTMLVDESEDMHLADQKQKEQTNEFKSQRRATVRGIPQALIVPLHKVLMDCDEFHNPRQLREVFSTQELMPWRDRLPGGDNLNARVAGIVGYLVDQRHTSKGNVLILLLRVLGEHYYPHPDDERHGRLLALADQLTWYGQRPPKPETTVLEANPEAAHMLWIADAERMLACARAVARVEVPRFRKGKQDGKSSGTGWLLARDLALTCWHVVESLARLETSVDPSDLQAQFDNTLLTFDYTVAGKGLQYGATAIEYPTIETQKLDYAVLRLVDRPDAPLRDRDYLRLDVDAPLNVQTSLYIIQHPLGHPQQGAGNTYIRPSPNAGRILYKTPTEPGTSGAPVFNRVNWRVVALHNGENETEQLREGTLLSAILADLEQNRPDLYGEIMTAQKAKE